MNKIQQFNNPFRHRIIDNFFDKDTLKYCFDYIKENKITKIVRCNNKRLLNYFQNQFPESYLINFPNHRSYTKLGEYLEVNICKKDSVYQLHDEAPHKIMSVVVYLSPYFTSGTFLYDQNKFLAKQIMWKPNRAFVFCGEPEVTWHSYGNRENESRITLNYFKTENESL